MLVVTSRVAVVGEMSHCDVSVNITLMDCLLFIYWANQARHPATAATLSQSHLTPRSHHISTPHRLSCARQATMLTCVKKRLEDSEADEGCYSRDSSEGSFLLSESGEKEIRSPADPNDPEQVAEYISSYLRSKVLPVRGAQGKILMTKVLQV